MPGKHLTIVVRHFANEQRRSAAALQHSADIPTLFDSRQRPGLRQPSGAFILAVIFYVCLGTTTFAETTASVSAPKFLGAQSCSASSCHGGAGEKSDQYTIWYTHDFHHARPYATLETARSERIADVLKIGNATQSARCTVCHAPFQTVPSERLGHDAQITEGISCESCHGPAENWIRSHTRRDYTHADRVATGMRDLKDLYVRANTCVACHQNIDPEIRAAGHPELIFELDGQSVTMPRHWAKVGDKPAFQIWEEGQWVALREMSWQSSQTNCSAQEQDRCAGLLWVMQTSMLSDNVRTVPALTSTNAQHIHHDCDEIAREISTADLPDSLSLSLTRQILGKLTATASEFQKKDISQSLQARRAERLVLALDRLTLSLPDAGANSVVNQSLNKLFADAQSLPDFDPKKFAEDLNTFHSSVAGFLETK